jgi:hypothetical protein
MKRHLTILALIFTVLLATTLVRAEAAPTFSVVQRVTSRDKFRL